MRTSQFLIKPVSESCNIDCKYCFYKDIANRRDIRNYGYMSYGTIEAIVKRAYNETEREVSFAFQGGEPLLRGIDFFQYFFELIDKYNTNNIRTNISLQTNGMLVTDEWAKLFKKHNVLVGVSLDGPEAIHDRYRLTYKHKPTHQAVMRGIEHLRKEGVNFNILSVLTKHVARNIRLVYQFFKEQQFDHIQFIEALDRNFSQKGKENYSLSNDDYYYFLSTCFQLWFNDLINGEYVSIRQFDVMVHKLLGNEHLLACFHQGLCTNQQVIEANGDVFPCDFYVTEENRLGNIHDHTLSEMNRTKLLERFIKRSTPIPDDCKSCPYFRMCRNGCYRYRINNKYKYCDALTRFYRKYWYQLLQVAEIVRSNTTATYEQTG